MLKDQQVGANQSPSRAQNTFALATVLVFTAVVVGGGWYLRTRNHDGSQAATPAPVSFRVGEVTAQLTGEFRMPQSEVRLDFKNGEGKATDVSQLTLSLTMNMPGMVMHDAAEVRGAHGHYIATVKPKMVGNWTAKLSFDGPQGPAEKTFAVTVR